jgi:hypothetical protein
MKLLIAIPALNEEHSIESIIERSLAARETIMAHSPVTQVEITVVSDGSTDGTVGLALPYTDRINLIVFEKNRGYGAAIKEAWRRSDADLLGFIDADGTCDPAFFAEACRVMERDHADVVVGCRMNGTSEMPRVRRVGNIIFAVILSAFSSTRVRDAASGLRVVRRSSLAKLMPLPDGLHFTPAMSARALLGAELRLSEIDMPYRERSGKSKLRIARDGMRFLKVIVNTASLYRPFRVLSCFGLLCLVLATTLMITPAVHWMEHRNVLEWMIYRFVVANLAATAAALLLCAGYLTRRIVDITILGPPRTRRLDAAMASRWFWAAPTTLVATGLALVIRSLPESLTNGFTYEHWSRFIAMSFLVSTALVLVVTRIIDAFLGLVSERLKYLRSLEADEPVDIIRIEPDAVLVH